MRGRLSIEETSDVAHALAAGRALLASTSTEQPVALYGAPLRGEALVLGAHQRAASALSAQARAGHDVLRRETGGVTLRTGAGVTYLALALHDRSVLMACPKLRILNRNVRGALAGFRLAGLAAHYFGRDFISVESQPATYVGWDAHVDGRVLLELFIAEAASYLPPSAAVGYPERALDPLRGKSVVTLQSLGARVAGTELVQKLADGYASAFKVDFEPHALAAAPHDEPLESADDAQLVWSRPREEVIGFVEAGVALDSIGKLRALRLAGDFFEDRGATAALERALSGVSPTHDLIGRSLDQVFAQSSHELEGVRELASLRESILDAVTLAKQRQNSA